MSEKQSTISFRLSASDRQMLERLASAEEESAGEIARRFVVERLQNKDSLRAIQMTNEAILEELKRVKEGLALSAEAVLFNQGKTLTRDEVKNWVDRNLRGKAVGA